MFALVPFSIIHPKIYSLVKPSTDYIKFSCHIFSFGTIHIEIYFGVQVEREGLWCQLRMHEKNICTFSSLIYTKEKMCICKYIINEPNTCFTLSFIFVVYTPQFPVRSALWAEMYSEISQASKMELLERIFVNYFRKKFDLGCLTVFWTHLWYCSKKAFF